MTRRNLLAAAGRYPGRYQIQSRAESKPIMELELGSNCDWDRTEHEEVVQLDQNWHGTGTGSHKYAINLNNMHQICKKIC